MRGEVKGKNFPKLHWYHHPFLRHSIQNSADCAVKNTALMLETTKKLKKVENVSACSSRCNQEPSCEFYKWKVNHVCRKTFTINILVTGPGQQESKSSRVPFDADQEDCKEELLVRTKKLLSSYDEDGDHFYWRTLDIGYPWLKIVKNPSSCLKLDVKKV